MSFEMLALCGAAVGLVLGLALRVRLGCMLLAAVPVGMFAYAYWSQAAHPTSTSALALVFVPLGPTLGAVGGFIAAQAARELIFKRRS